MKAKKGKNKKRKKILLVKKREASFSVQSFFKAKIKVVGIGGGGGSIVSEIGRSLPKASFVIADTDSRAIRKRAGIKYFLFGQHTTHGLGTGANSELANQAALQEQEKIKQLFRDQDIVILIASLGGGLGSGATEVFARMASSFGAITFGIFTLPFKFEGKNKSRIALRALKDLREILNVSITIPNEKIFKVISQNTPITEAFSVVNKNLIESLESLVDLIYNPGMINIDFADLRAVLRGKGSIAFLNTVEQTGKNRAEEIAKKIMHNPLYYNSSFEVEKILYNIAGPHDMSMFEVEKISNSISAQHPKAKIIFGISKNSGNKRQRNKVKATLLMTGSPHEKELPKEIVKIEDKIKITEKISAPKKKRPKKIIEKPAIEPIAIAPQFPVFPANETESSIALDRKLSVIELPDKPAKKAIRRNALDIKKAREDEEIKRVEQEQEWEIPAFLRRVKFKS